MKKSADASPVRGGLRFAIIMLCLFAGLFWMAGWWGSEETTAPPIITATPTAPSGGVHVQLDAAPAVSLNANPVVNIEQAAPAPPPPVVQDNTAALMAHNTASEAARLAANAERTAVQALGEVGALESRVTAVETAVPNIAPTLMQFEQRTDSLQRQLGYALSGLVVTLFLVIVLGVMALRQSHTPPYWQPYLSESPAPPTPPKLTPAILRPRIAPEVNRSSERFRTVPNWLELPLDGSVEPDPAIRQLWRNLHRHGMTKTKICEMFYESKGANYRWIKLAFDEATIAEEANNV